MQSDPAKPSRLLQISWKLIARFAPEAISSQNAFFEALEPRLEPGPLWLDLGCGRELVPSWMSPRDFARFGGAAARARAVVGIDGDTGSLRDNPLARKVLGDIAVLPLRSETFELASANMVVEHVAEPEACLREIARVLKPGGTLVLHTPNLRSPLIALISMIPAPLKKALARFVDGRGGEDVFPTRYRLNTPRRIRAVAAACGFRVAELKVVPTAPVTLFLGPVVLLELAAIRVLRWNLLARLRPDIVAVLVKE